MDAGFAGMTENKKGPYGPFLCIHLADESRINVKARTPITLVQIWFICEFLTMQSSSNFPIIG